MARDDYDDDATVIVERRSVGLGAFLTGLAIGAGIALLMTPQSGPELRRDLKRRAKRAQRVARDLSRDMRSKAEDMLDDAKSQLETRVAIVRKKAEIESIPLSDEVAVLLAQNIQSNVRELEGALIRLAAKSSLTGRPSTKSSRAAR